MTLQDFETAIRMELHLRRERFDRGDLERFVEDVWPLAQEDPDPARWATAFLANRTEARLPMHICPSNLFPDITDEGEIFHSLLMYRLHFDKGSDSGNVFLKGPDLGQCIALPGKGERPA